MWLRGAVAGPPPVVADVVVVVVAANEEFEDWPQTTSRLDLLAQRTMRADSIFSIYKRHELCILYKKMNKFRVKRKKILANWSTAKFYMLTVGILP